MAPKIRGTKGWLSCLKEEHLCSAIYASDSHSTHVEDQAKARFYLRPHLSSVFSSLVFLPPLQALPKNHALSTTHASNLLSYALFLGNWT